MACLDPVLEWVQISNLVHQGTTMVLNLLTLHDILGGCSQVHNSTQGRIDTFEEMQDLKGAFHVTPIAFQTFGAFLGDQP